MLAPGRGDDLENAAKIDPRLYLVTGGFHLVLTPEAEVRRVASALHDTLKLQRVAPAHCTSELGFSVFLERFKGRFDHAGLGSVIYCHDRVAMTVWRCLCRAEL